MLLNKLWVARVSLWDSYEGAVSHVSGSLLTMLAAALVLSVPAFVQGDVSAASSNNDNSDSECTYNSTPLDVPVTAVPIVVASTPADYFVLYVQPNLDDDLEFPVSVTLGKADATTLTEQLSALPKEHYRVEKYPVADPGDVDGDCTHDLAELADMGTMNPLNPAAAIDIHHGAVAIPDRGTFEKLSYQGSDVLRDGHLTDLEYVKFFIYGSDDTVGRPFVYFMNTETHRAHVYFAGAVDPRPHREALRGEIVYHPNAIAPDGSLGVYRFEFQSWEAYSFSVIQETFERLTASMPLLDNNLAYYPMPSNALLLYNKEKALYDASRVNVLLENDIFPDVPSISLNLGTGYGFLRHMSADERPHPRDIVIYETLPNELPRVAGIITTIPQTPLSHVNLRAVQDRVPNAFIRDALDDDSTVKSLIGSHVKYTVTQDGYTILAATKAEVDTHYQASRPPEVQTPERDLSVTEITALSDVAFEDWTAFGVKAANVAVLGGMDFPENTVPNGFAVPFYFYDEFMKANDLDEHVSTMLADSEFQTDFDEQEDELKKLRKAIKRATTPDWIITALETMHGKFPDGTSLRYRSSTNNEDLPRFSGAGLYDSKTQDPDETEEDGIDKSIKAVWASLWNFRAFVEREFHRIDHATTAMGVLVHPNYSDEKANGVAVSYDPINNREDVYYVNTQVGEDLVTNPEAHSVPEELLLEADGSYKVLVHSNRVATVGELILSDPELKQLREHLAKIHDKFKSLYQPAEGERFAMEIEFKITSADVLAIKQARPWVFRPATAPYAPAITGVTPDNAQLTVAWRAPLNTGGADVKSYDVRYILTGTDKTVEGNWTVISDAWTSTDGGTLSETITGLTNRSEYEVQVQAENSAGNGPWSATMTGTPRTTSVPGRPPRPAPQRGSSGSGSGGSGSAAGDAHGNSPATASRVALGAQAPWATSVAGQINTAGDVDYFTFTVPWAGVVQVETAGGMDTVGTLWQEGVELGQASSGGGDFRLRHWVAAGPAVVAVAGEGGRTGSYTLKVHLVVGYLENPGPNSFQSGIGVISGWVCEAEEVLIEIDGQPRPAGYGTERLDTEGVCGDTDNGFGLLFNWNELGDGEHTVVAVVDGEELGRAVVQVTTLGEPFVRDVAGECVLEDFPQLGQTVTLEWQQNGQNFVIAGGEAPRGANRAGVPGVGYLENPGPNSFQSGIGVISGWVCEAEEVLIEIDGQPRPAGYGTERLDTEGVCGDTDNGFGLLFNWNELGDGEHTVVAVVDGEELGRAVVQVTTLGEPFVRDVAGECVLEDFPQLGQTVTLEWQQNGQNFVIIPHAPDRAEP